MTTIEIVRNKTKWPSSLTIFRHGQSEYNVLKAIKMKDPEYLAFIKEYKTDHRSREAKRLAKIIRERYALKTSDHETDLTPVGVRQAFITGQRLFGSKLPKVIHYSPYKRTENTLSRMADGWEQAGKDSYISTGLPFDSLRDVPWIADDRIREQEHGLSLLYSDWRVFHVFHPEQKELHELLGMYDYQYPQGESTTQVRDRGRTYLSMLVREFSEQDVWAVSHHLFKLATRANIERLSPKQFLHLDENEKPVNCGITRYVCDPDAGKEGKLILDFYNKKLYEDHEVV